MANGIDFSFEPIISTKIRNEDWHIGAIITEEVVLVVEKEAEITHKRIQKQLEYGKHSIDKEARPDRIVFKRLPRKGRQQKIDRNQIKETLQKV